MVKRENPEKWYQQKWCEAQKGRVEVVLSDGTRCDCVTETHAIEFDFGKTGGKLLDRRSANHLTIHLIN